MRVNEFPKESIQENIFILSDNPLAYFQEKPGSLLLVSLNTPQIFPVALLSSYSLLILFLLQSHFSKSHPFFTVCFSVTSSFMESSHNLSFKNTESVTPSNPRDFPTFLSLLLLLHIACRDGYGMSYAATQKKYPTQSVSSKAPDVLF